MQNITTTRALNALKDTPYNTQNAPAICSLIDFAAQPPGLDFGNYSNPFTFRQEARRILTDWKKVKGALHECAQLEVTDQIVIDASRRAFSGRLEWHWFSKAADMPEGRWEYTTGQYWPTEYRKAAFAVLSMAASLLRESRPKRAQVPTTIAELKTLNRENGGHWFDDDTMKFFGTKIESGINEGCLFISSEQRNEDTKRVYSLRSFNEFGQVTTVGKCGEYATKRSAWGAMRKHQKALKTTP